MADSYAAAASQAANAAKVPTPRTGQDAQYWRARRSSRFFPVLGETEVELKRNLYEFCTEKLRIPSGDLLDEDVEHVRRVRLRRGRESFAEVVVLFSDLKTRDRIVSYARNLGQFVDGKGKPTAGIRFEIPDHLSGIHRTLLQYGRALWTKNNKSQDFQRNVRFDDVGMTFCLDVKLPGKKEWMTVTYERAARESKLNKNLDEEEDLLSLGPVMIDGTEMGAGAAGGSVTLTSWRAPTGK